MVDWSLSRQIAGFAAGSAPVPDLGVDLDELAARSLAPLSEYTGFELRGALPPAEAVARREWAEINLDTLAEMLGPVAGRLDGRLSSAGPLAGALRAAAGATLAAEAGLVMGYVSQRVLGQYELSLLQPPEAPPAPGRLLFVAPNLERAATAMKVDAGSFYAWVVLHELTHVLQFSAVPWLRDHLGSLLREYIETLDVRIQRGAAGGLPSFPDPARIVADFREGGLAALVQTREQRGIMRRMQSAMAIVEGYSEHVMDVLGARMLDDYEGLREAMDRRRRSRSAPEQVLQRLLGLDMKLRQYELGKRFCDAVVERHGIGALNQVWGSPEALPSARELDAPDAWVARMGRQSEPATPAAAG